MTLHSVVRRIPFPDMAYELHLKSVDKKFEAYMTVALEAIMGRRIRRLPTSLPRLLCVVATVKEAKRIKRQCENGSLVQPSESSEPEPYWRHQAALLLPFPTIRERACEIEIVSSSKRSRKRKAKNSRKRSR
jgi:hypothetical protein